VQEKIARMKIDRKKFLELLGFPEGTILRNIRLSSECYQAIEIQVSHEDLLPVEEGRLIPEIYPIVTLNIREHITFDWNQKKEKE